MLNTVLWIAVCNAKHSSLDGGMQCGYILWDRALRVGGGVGALAGFLVRPVQLRARFREGRVARLRLIRKRCVPWYRICSSCEHYGSVYAKARGACSADKRGLTQLDIAGRSSQVTGQSSPAPTHPDLSDGTRGFTSVPSQAIHPT